MAPIKLVYIGGGSTRAPGTLAAFVKHAAQFAGSEIVLVDLDRDALELVRRVGQRFIDVEGADLKLSLTTDRNAALVDADAVLSSFRPGGFEARALDEKIPLRHGVIGQETQGPGGFFMALRSIAVLQQITVEMERLCPRAWLINYTNPINLVSEAVTRFSPIRAISLCEGPVYFPAQLAKAAGLNLKLLDTVMIGLNHACWSVRHVYDGQDAIPIFKQCAEQVLAAPDVQKTVKRQMQILCAFDHIPADYFQYYYFKDEMLAELQTTPLTRADYLLTQVPTYLAHYREQAEAAQPLLDPGRSRGGINELELAVDVLAAIINDENRTLPCNVPNRGAIRNFPGERVVEVPCLVNGQGATPAGHYELPTRVAGLVEMLGEYQALAAEVAWHGTRADGIRALASNPLVLDLPKATRLYDELAAAHRSYLPERLLN